MPEKEFDLEGWWENDLPDTDKFNVETFRIIEGSLSKTTAWGDVGTIGLNPSIPESDMPNILARTFEKLQISGIADEWFYIIRRCDSFNTDDCVVESENLIYGSKTSTKIKNGYTALPLAELYFHVLRAYTRANEGDFVSAQTLWKDIHENWLHHASEYRKPFVLSSLYLTSLCINDWEQSMRYIKQLWSITKFMDGVKRHSMGVWDEWTVCLMVSWFFMKYSRDFQTVYYDQTYPFVFQKKSIILQNLKDSFIADVIPKVYYDMARELNPQLPEIQYKEKPVASLRLSVPSM